MYQWRRFQFFDKESVKEETATNIQKGVVNCTASGRGNLIIGYNDGYLSAFDRDWNPTFSFKAYIGGITHIQTLKTQSVVVTIGDDEEAISPTIKIWNVDKKDKTGDPLCMKVIKLPQPIPVTVMAVVEDLSQIAIGLVNGTVLLIRGDLKQTKQFILQPEGQSPVTGMAFKQSSTTIVLFVVTSDNVSTYHTGGKEIYKEELDSAFGSGIGCAVLSDEEDLIVARKEAVYFYEVEGRGPCFAFEGEKKLLHWFRGYLVVVGHDPNNLKFNSLTIYDLKNKFIAYSENRFQNISHIVTEWGAIFIFTGDGKIFHLEEKDTQTKLETLFKKNLYSVAINLAQSQNLDYASIIDIFRKYGDHLYLKGDYDGAISQYIRTIGKLEPSYVIRKFLDAQRIHNLTSYLQTLHEKGLANADHTTLLFNCYTKLKDVKKLDEFIKTESDMSFDIDTAIKACRQSQYYEHALYLAKRHNQHDQYLKILLEDLKGFQQALQYIATLDFFEAEKTLKKYGKVLVTSLPQQTTDLLEKLCIDYVPTLPPNPTPTTLTNTSSSSSKTSTPTTMSPVLSPKEELFSRSTPITVTATTSNNDIKVKAVPDEFIHIYVNQPEWLIKFIEFIISKGQASNLLYNTLLELYMRDETTIVQLINTSNTNNSNSTTNNNNSTIIENRSNEEVKITKRQLTYEEQNNRRKEALKLLTNSQSKYDDDYALVLCKLHSFREGLLYLYEKLQVFNEIIEYYMENNEYDLIIQSCKTYGSKDSNLWVHALTYFANKKEECTKEITEILTNIDRNNLLPPLLVIQILSQKSTATLALIKDYITRRLNTENQYINEDSKQIKNYKDETKKMRSEIQELKTTAKIFQLNKCTYCNVALDLPAVHFLCMHSFHQRCLGENESECPNCAPQNKKIIEIKRSLQENVGQHDQFFRKLEGSADGFNVVSEYFSKGIFNSLPTAPDTPSSKQKPKINF